MIRQWGCLFFFSWVSLAFAGSPWADIENLWGRAGLESGKGLLLTFPRFDLNVMIDGVPLDPAMGLTSQILFMPQEKGVRIQGEFVVLDQEMGRVEARLLQQGFTLTEAGSFLEGETPAVKRIVFTAQGNGFGLSQKLKTILNGTGTPLDRPEKTTAEASDDDWSLEQSEFGQKGITQGKALKLNFPAASSGVSDDFDSSVLIFQPNGDQLMVVGKLLVLPAQAADVLKILARKKIIVTSLSTESPPAAPVTRLRFWGSGSPQELMPVLKKALLKIGILAASGEAGSDLLNAGF
jgi:hypothetical protein